MNGDGFRQIAVSPRRQGVGFELLFGGDDREPESMAWVSQYAHAKSTAQVDDL